MGEIDESLGYSYIWYRCSHSSMDIFKSALSADNTSAQDSKDNEKWEECTDEDVLREAVRLAELRIEELSQTIRILEHKAIALVTLCFAVMGYFYTIEEWSCNFFELLRGVALFSLFIPSLFGIRVVFFRAHWHCRHKSPSVSLAG